ncbi:PIN domain-containing protein [Allomesorhizobium camelthorni]|uniref:Ribonuclease VapC n=1 Tax=Allomesorhizobium camelthorni TaxID=475069 RepID=A0A6G4W7B2_9HYPH|nr:type II toxin-antitoxin system VapC family toxin [Mesorhizobium camelthorni]
MFVDTSAFIAVLADEEDGLDLAAKIYDSPGCTTSALVVLEAVMRLTSKLRVEPREALARLEAFLGEASVVVTAIEPGYVYLAVEAFTRFGKGRGHPAQLNLADCLSYACAKSRGVPLLYKGNDFSRTDLK